MNLKILDLCCGAGGTAVGLKRAFPDAEIVGVDNRPQPRYPFEFVKFDALAVADDKYWMSQFQIIHVAAPCQLWSQTRHLGKKQNQAGKVDVLTPMLEIARNRSTQIWVFENVERVPPEIFYPTRTLQLCGSMFPGHHGFDSRRHLRRHRKFFFPHHTVPISYQPRCRHNGFRPLGVYGSLNDAIPGGGDTARNMQEAEQLMGIDWMNWRELREAIPPAYGEYVGKFIKELL